MAYGQGHPEDYPVPAEDAWEALEGLGEPLLQQPHGLERLPPVFRAVVDAFAMARVPWLGSHGGFPAKVGVGFPARWARRWSAFDQALGPQRNASLLGGPAPAAAGGAAVLQGARARRLLFGRGSTGGPPRVESVEVLLDGNATWHVPTRRVVLAAGVFGTPAVLLASDVARHCNATVGRDLQDHIGFRTLFSLRGASCSEWAFGSDGAWARSVVQAKLQGRALVDFVAYLGEGRPLAQVVLEPMCGGTGQEMRLAFSMDVILLRGTTRGRVRQAKRGGREGIRGRALRTDFVVSEEDMNSLMRIFTFLRVSVFGSPRLAAYPAEPHPIGSFPAVDDLEGLYRHIRGRMQNFYHMAGTSHRALDHRLRLRGCRGVRVADASAFKEPVVGHPDVPTRALGRVVAKYMLEDEGLR